MGSKIIWAISIILVFIVLTTLIWSFVNLESPAAHFTWAPRAGRVVPLSVGRFVLEED